MNYTGYLRWGVVGALFAALLVPFIIADGGALYSSLNPQHNLYLPVTNLFFPYITGKNFVFRILVEFAGFGYLLLALRVPKYRPKASLLMWSVAALVVWMGISTLASVDSVKSFWSNFERMDGYINLLHLAAWFVMTGAVFAADNLWGRFLETAVGASVVQGIIALMQVTHVFGFAPSSQSGARADTTFGNATYLAVYMLMSAFLTLFLMARRSREGRLSAGLQVWYGIALVLQVMGLYLTETRGAQLGFLIGIAVAALWMAVYLRASKEKRLRQVAIGGLVALVAVVGLFIGIRNTSFVRQSSALNRLASISLNETTIASRIKYIWPTALKGIVEKPIQGWGFENFNYVFNQHYQPEMYAQEQWFDRAHDEFLDMGIWGGIPAMLIYLSLFGFSAWIVWRSRLSVIEQAVLFGLLAGYAFNNLAVFDNLVSYMYFFTLLALIGSYAAPRPPRFVAWARPMGEHGLAVAAPVALLAFGFIGWYFNAPGLARAEQLVNGLSAQQGPAQNLAYFTQATSATAFPGNQLGFQEAAEQLAQFTVNQVEPAGGVDPKIKQQYVAAASDALQREMTVRPHDARLELFMGSLLSSAGATNEALTYLKAAAADSPQKQQILVQEGLLQIQTGDTQSAIATMKQAYDEVPDYDFARVMLAAAYYYAGQVPAGDQLLIDKWGTTIVDNDTLVTIYSNLKMWARVEAIWQLRIKQSPSDINLYMHLAQTYFNAGDKADTIKTLQAAVKVQPALAGEVQKLIDAINNGSLKPAQQ